MEKCNCLLPSQQAEVGTAGTAVGGGAAAAAIDAVGNMDMEHGMLRHSIRGLYSGDRILFADNVCIPPIVLCFVSCSRGCLDEGIS